MLECLGGRPSTHLHEPLPNNPKGFFEDFDIQRFNEYELLPALGARWHDVTPLDWTRLSDESRAELSAKAVGIVGKNFSRDNSLSILKEPRLGILLPFWLAVLEEAGFEVKAVCTVRDPLSVARSLHARDAFSITHGAMLYASNWLATLQSLGNVPTSYLSFDSIFRDARGGLERLARELGIPLPQDFDARIEDFVSDHLDSGLRHSIASAEEVTGDPRIPPVAAAVHATLLDAVDSHARRDAMDRLSAWATRHSDSVPLLHDYDRLFRDRATLLQTAINHENEIAGLRDHLANTEAERDVTSRDQKVAERDDSLNELRSLLLERNGEVAALTDELADRKTTLSSLQAIIEDLTREVVERESAVQELEKNLLATNDSLVEKEVALCSAKDRTVELLESLAQAEAQNARLADAIASLESRLESQRAEDEKREATIQHLVLALSSTRTTTWSRVTAPVRWLAEAVGTSPLGLSRAMREIRESGLFDPVFYLLKHPDVRDSGVDPLKHYLLHGGHQGRNPSPLFDSHFYLDQYVDVRASRINPLLHYIRFGRAEGRLPVPHHQLAAEPPPSETPVARDIRIIRESGRFDAAYYLEQHPDVRHAGVDPIEHFVWHGWKEGRNPSPFFDTRFYLRIYLDSDLAGDNPLLHFIQKGQAEGNFASEAHRAEARRVYGQAYWNRLLTYLVNGSSLPAIGRFFRKLVSIGPDEVARDFRERATHAGQGLGEDAASTGDRLPSRESLPESGTILFIGCNGLLAGSQVVLLNIIKWLHAHTTLDVKIILLSGGELLPEYATYGSVVVWQELALQLPDVNTRREHLAAWCGKVDLVYGNTILAATIYEEMEFLGAPFLSHVHELEQTIRAYAQPHTIDTFQSLTSEFIACSPPVAANLVENHRVSSSRIHTVNAFIENRASIAANAKRGLRKTLGLREREFVVVGCGTIYARKGVDLFVDTAVKLKESGAQKFRFLWIGDHYWDFDPQSRRLMAWNSIEATIRKHGMEDLIEFPGVKTNAREYFAAADVFYLPSREDPFPLVCLEAAQCGTPVVCFDKAGGMPAFVETDAGLVVPHLDVDAAVAAIKRLKDDARLCNRLGTGAASKLARLHTDDIAVPEILKICRKAMRTGPMVSVIVPVFNHGRFLVQRMESILSQSFRDFEIIILDDASTDDSFEVARRYEGHPQVRIARNEHNSGSPFRQWKKGLELAHGTIVWIAEGDDASEPDFLRRLLPFFRDPEVAIAYCDSKVIDENGHSLENYEAYYESLDFSHWKMDRLLSGEAEINFGLGVKNTIPNTSAALFRREFIDSAMLENISSMRYSGDWFFHVQMVKGRKIAFRRLPLNLHRKHASTLTHQFNRNETQQHALLDEARRVHEYVLANYTPTPSFRRKLAFYLNDQIESLFHGTPKSQHDRLYPVTRTLEAVDRAIAASSPLATRMAFITTGDVTHDGGSEQLWIQTALRMARTGHRVLVVIKRWSPEPYFFAEFRDAGIELVFKDSKPVERLVDFPPHLVVINIGDQDEGIDWYAACRANGLRYTIVNHLTKEPRYWPIRPELQDAVREGNLGAAQVLFTSQNNRALLEKRLGCAIPHAGVFHNPIYIDRTKRLPFPSMDGPIRLAMPSRLLTIHKGQNIAIEVFSRKKWRNRNIQLHIYGNGPDEASLRDTVAREDLTNVFFHAPNWQLPTPDMESIWRDNHALLMTSFMEGMPLVLLNAMFYERVAIVTDIGGHREVVQDGMSGFIAAEPSPDAVDRAMENAWRSLGTWEQIGRRARTRMLQFALEDPVADFIEKLSYLSKVAARDPTGLASHTTG
jgi:glycosyltransferase involved in cell wall biosynthesis